MHLNIEIKAYCSNPDEIRTILQNKGAEFKGTDHQIDTYFNCTHGRLKLREGNIENNLIHYQRQNTEGPKRSDVILFKSDPDSSLKKLLEASLGILTVVDKKREIYFIDNVKFHVDEVKTLGSFVEIEAIDQTLDIGEFKLMEQCNHYVDLFQIQTDDLIADSYSDLLIKTEIG